MFIQKSCYALVEVPKYKGNRKLTTSGPQIIPINVVEKTFEVNVQSLLSLSTTSSTNSNKKRGISSSSKITVTRKALPFVPAFSMTTHKAQGQTLPKVVVDLRLPPGREEIASRYVPLGRVKSRKDIAILRDFSFSALQVKPSKAQRTELDRLDNLNSINIQNYQAWKK
ncbi:unnamed protein product [Adineta steineri]|nr:unnamed protein product [Adineta steineri]